MIYCVNTFRLVVFAVLLTGFLFLFQYPAPVDAASQDQLTLCSQNLNNYREGGKPSVKQEEYLVDRFKNAKCDVIAVQEVVGESTREAEHVLAQLARALSGATGEKFAAIVGKTRDKRIRNGFLVKHVFPVREEKSFYQMNLPKLEPRSAGDRFSRGPLAIVISAGGKDFFLLSVHLKSKVDGWKDPSETKFETLRMEMAAGIRQIIFEEKKKRKNETVFVVLGDLNSYHSSAALDVLSGEFHLEDYRGEEGCRVNKTLESECDKKRPQRKASLVPLFGYRVRVLGEPLGGGSYRYKGEPSIIDEIVIERERLPLVMERPGTLAIGYEGVYQKGSDHKLAWARFKW